MKIFKKNAKRDEINTNKESIVANNIEKPYDEIESNTEGEEIESTDKEDKPKKLAKKTVKLILAACGIVALLMILIVVKLVTNKKENIDTVKEDMYNYLQEVKFAEFSSVTKVKLNTQLYGEKVSMETIAKSSGIRELGNGNHFYSKNFENTDATGVSTYKYETYLLNGISYISYDGDTYYNTDKKYNTEYPKGIVSLIEDLCKSANSLKLNSNTGEINGEQCYNVYGTIEDADYIKYLMDSAEMEGLLDFSHYGGWGVRVDIDLYINQKTKKPVYLFLEIKKAGKVFAEVLTGESGSGLDVNVTEFTVSYDFTEFHSSGDLSFDESSSIKVDNINKDSSKMTESEEIYIEEFKYVTNYDILMPVSYMWDSISALSYKHKYSTSKLMIEHKSYEELLSLEMEAESEGELETGENELETGEGDLETSEQIDLVSMAVEYVDENLRRNGYSNVVHIEDKITYTIAEKDKSKNYVITVFGNGGIVSFNYMFDDSELYSQYYSDIITKTLSLIDMQDTTALETQIEEPTEVADEENNNKPAENYTYEKGHKRNPYTVDELISSNIADLSTGNMAVLNIVYTGAVTDKIIIEQKLNEHKNKTGKEIDYEGKMVLVQMEFSTSNFNYTDENNVSLEDIKVYGAEILNEGKPLSKNNDELVIYENNKVYSFTYVIDNDGDTFNVSYVDPNLGNRELYISK